MNQLPINTPKYGELSPDIERVYKSVLSVPSVVSVKSTSAPNGSLDGIRAIVDGSISNKEVARAIETVLLIDLDFTIDYRKIFVVARDKRA